MHSNLSEHPVLIHATQRLEQLKPDQFEIYFENRSTTRVDSRNQEIDTFIKSEDIGLSFRVIKNNKLGFSFTTSMEKNAVERAIQTAFETSQFMPEDIHLGLYSFSSTAYPHVDNFDVRGLKVPIADKIALAKKLENACRATDPRVKAVRLASLSETSVEVLMLDSSGEKIQHQSTGYTASVTCKAEQDGDSQMGGDFGFSNELEHLNIDQIALGAANYAVEILGAKPAPTMKCPAVFRNTVMADLVDFLSASFSAEEMEKGRSMLAGKLGQLIFSEQITLIDDGLLAGGAGSSPFDGEGIPSRKTTLVDGGMMTGGLYDLYHSKKAGKEPTSSSLRGIKAPPSIGFSNLFIQKGRRTFDNLLDGIQKGVLITDLMGLHTANPVTGEFSVGASGILIENGKLSRPVRGFAVAGNILDLFRKITDVGNDLRFFGRIGAPSVRLSEVSIGGT